MIREGVAYFAGCLLGRFIEYVVLLLAAQRPLSWIWVGFTQQTLIVWACVASMGFIAHVTLKRSWLVAVCVGVALSTLLFWLHFPLIPSFARWHAWTNYVGAWTCATLTGWLLSHFAERVTETGDAKWASRGRR